MGERVQKGKLSMSTLEEILKLTSLLSWMGIVTCLIFQWALVPKGLILTLVLAVVAIATYGLSEIGEKNE